MTGQEFLDKLKDIVYRAEIKADYLDGDIVDDVQALVYEYEDWVEEGEWV
jgi:hypothetical protein